MITHVTNKVIINYICVYIYIYINIWNLSKISSEQYITELFDLRSTSYLSENCFTETPTGRKKGNFKNFAFITAPEHGCNELMRLSGITV